MSIVSILNLLRAEYLYIMAKIILFYSTSSMHLIMNLQEFHFLFITYPLTKRQS